MTAPLHQTEKAEVIERSQHQPDVQPEVDADFQSSEPGKSKGKTRTPTSHGDADQLAQLVGVAEGMQAGVSRADRPMVVDQDAAERGEKTDVGYGRLAWAPGS